LKNWSSRPSAAEFEDVDVRLMSRTLVALVALPTPRNQTRADLTWRA
jgi:hypothetical protein